MVWNKSLIIGLSDEIAVLVRDGYQSYLVPHDLEPNS